MSTGQISRQRSKSSSSKNVAAIRSTPPPTTLTPDNADQELEPCAATASFLLYAQRNLVLCVHHDTLAIERRFDAHKEDIVWIAVDNVSDRGAGRLAASHDKGNTTLVWDLFTGGIVGTFTSYEEMKVATWMRNGNLALGNSQGAITLFEPSTTEHFSSRTIFDPVTALAPAADCKTFAIGYLNGSILVANLQPSFTILHTLTTTRSPSRITGLAWHGSSSKQKTDMLATQTLDGDLRVWSIPKVPYQDSPNIIRILSRADVLQPGPCWFAWSKNGRIVQYADGETRSWDVRTKKVTYEIIPTLSGVTGVTNYGPTATLFTMGRNHSVQQFDINPSAVPTQVASVQHAPANTPPTPPTSLEETKHSYKSAQQGFQATGPVLPRTGYSETESSADENGAMSPLQRIAKEIDSLDQMEDELRDQLMPLSPTSSRTSSVSSRSSGRGPKGRKYLYDRPSSSRASSSVGNNGTEFSFGTEKKQGHDSMSIRSTSSFASHSRHQSSRSSNLRKEVLRSPQEAEDTAHLDLFPFTKTRLRDIPFRTPQYGNVARTPEILQREMLNVVFGWNGSVESLIREELGRQRPGSAGGVLLAKWLGEMGADVMASMVGSESMTSSDWMLLALSSIGAESQKKVGEAFVHRLLEKGDIHPAAAILLGLGETNDAIEVYVSSQFYMEAVLLTCLTCPADWQRQSFLVRKWGELAVQSGQPELAVRCFSCTSIETSEPWFSPRAQDAVYAAQQERFNQPLSADSAASPPLSPPSATGSSRMAQKNAALKLITTFGEKGAPVKSRNDAAYEGTPIESALSPRGLGPWGRSKSRNAQDPSSARTATPGGFTRRNRVPSRTDIERAKQEAADLSAAPATAVQEVAPFSNATRESKRPASSASGSQEPTTALRPTAYDALAPERMAKQDDHLPSPAQGVFSRFKEGSKARRISHEKKPDHLAVQILDTQYPNDLSSAPSTRESVDDIEQTRAGAMSPPLTGNSMRSAKARAVDKYISSVEEARTLARQQRAESRNRNQSRRRGESHSRAGSRMREPSTSGVQEDTHYVKPANRSPSSPVPMSPEEVAQASQSLRTAVAQDEDFYRVTSPVESRPSVKSGKSGAHRSRRHESPEPAKPTGVNSRAVSRTRSRQRSSSRSFLTVEDRGRGEQRTPNSIARSPSSPLPMSPERGSGDASDTQSDGQRVRLGIKDMDKRPDGGLQSRRAASRTRVTPTSRQPSARKKSTGMSNMDNSKDNIADDQLSESSMSMASDTKRRRPRGLSRKQLAAKELEERRLSLARRPSAPSIPLPGDVPLSGGSRPGFQRSHTDLTNSPHSFQPPLSRSQTVDPESMGRHGLTSGTSTSSAPIGLPATPRAMRHPRYINADPDRENAPPVPHLPENFNPLTGSNLSALTNSNLSQLSSIAPESDLTRTDLTRPDESSELDSVAPLLPSTVFGQRGPQAPPRSASAPPEKSMGGMPTHPAYSAGLPFSNKSASKGGHFRNISPPEKYKSQYQTRTSIDEALSYNDDQIVVVGEEDNEPPPPVLPELQHLTGPPPPPPPPTMHQQSNSHVDLGTFSIAIEDHAAGSKPPEGPNLPQPMDRATTASPSMQRNRGSVSESFGARFRRLRSNSHSRAKSPPAERLQPTPYETVLPHMPSHHRRESISRAKSPYEQAMAAQQESSKQNNMIPPPPPPPPAPPAPGNEGKLNETSIPPAGGCVLPQSRSGSAMGYRNPKEIRANMPPEYLQQGAHPVQGGFL
ncbi:hypothetical protein MBLNU230_g1759t1 [Neophaeotheca triangularis]